MRLIIDCPYLAHRSYLAPYKKRLTNSNGEDSTMIYTFFKSLNKLIHNHKPDELIMTWESHGTTQWRRQLYPEYKPTKPIIPEYVTQLLDIQNILYNEKIPSLYSPTNEADDVIATLIDDTPTRIFSIDKDLMQLIDDSIPVEMIIKDRIIKEADVMKKFGVPPSKIPLFLALAGDTTDGIPGLTKIGLKKAVKLLEDYPTFSKLTEEQRKLVWLYNSLTVLNRDAKYLKLIPSDINTTSHIINKYELKDFSLNFKKKEQKPNTLW